MNVSRERVQMSNAALTAPFVIRLAVIATPATALQAAIPDLEEELDEREHLAVQQVRWDDAASQIIVEIVEYWEDNARQAAAQMQEELFEIMAAVLIDIESYRVEIVDVQPLDVE